MDQKTPTQHLKNSQTLRTQTLRPYEWTVLVLLSLWVGLSIWWRSKPGMLAPLGGLLANRLPGDRLPGDRLGQILAAALKSWELPAILLALAGTQIVWSRARARRENLRIEHPGVTFADLAGQEEAKSALREVLAELQAPGEHSAGAANAVLLLGSAGTGKTSLARAAAAEAHLPLIILPAGRLAKLSASVWNRQVRSLQARVRQAGRAVILIDDWSLMEQDGQFPRKTFLAALKDSLASSESVILATARRLPPDGLFDRRLILGLPDRQSREGTLRIHTRGLKLAAHTNLGLLARTTTGFSEADLASLCAQAASAANKDGREEVGMPDFQAALERRLLSSPTLLLNEQERRTAAFHQAGHALAAWLAPAVEPLSKVTILPEPFALSTASQLLENNHRPHTRENLLAFLAIILAGRAAEEIGIGEISTCAEDDLLDATSLARRMVTRWGMGRLGPVALETPEALPPRADEAQSRAYSEETAARIDRDIQDLLQNRYAAARNFLADSHEQLDRLVEALLRDETIYREGMARIVGPRPVNQAASDHWPVEVASFHHHTSIS